jgi:hypothetical protein
MRIQLDRILQQHLRTNRFANPPAALDRLEPVSFPDCRAYFFGKRFQYERMNLLDFLVGQSPILGLIPNPNSNALVALRNRFSSI